MNFWTMESANLFAGTQPTDVSNSNHLTLTEVKLPSMEKQYVDHRPGGTMMAVEIGMLFARLDCTFNLLGWSPQVAELLSGWTSQDQQFFIYGNIRDQISHAAIQAVAEIHGELGRADPQNWRRGDVQHWQYSIRGIYYYDLTLPKVHGYGRINMYHWDFFNNEFLVGANTVMIGA